MRNEPLIAKKGEIFTNGIDYGSMIWPADGVDPNSYYPISVEEYEAILAARAEEVPE